MEKGLFVKELKFIFLSRGFSQKESLYLIEGRSKVWHSRHFSRPLLRDHREYVELKCINVCKVSIFFYEFYVLVKSKVEKGIVVKELKLIFLSRVLSETTSLPLTEGRGRSVTPHPTLTPLVRSHWSTLY